MLFKQSFRQVFLLTTSNLKARYRKTFAGFIWVVINPLVLFGAQCIAFKTFLKIDIPNYFLFLLGNLLPWIFLVNCLTMCVSIFVEKRQLLRSFSIEPLVLIWSQLMDNFFNFLAAFLLLFIPIALIYDFAPAGLLLLPIALVLLGLGAFFLSAFLAILNVFFQDTRYLVSFLTSVLFFLTPIFYPIEFVPVEFHPLIEMNIFYILITPIRICLYDFQSLDFFIAIAKAAVAVGISGIVFTLYWRYKKNEFFMLL